MIYLATAYVPPAVTDVGHVARPLEAVAVVAVNGIEYYYSPAKIRSCLYFMRYAIMGTKKKVVAVSQFRLGSMDFAAPDDIVEEASQAICQLFKIPDEGLFIMHTCPHCPRRFRSYTDWIHHIQWTRYGKSALDFTCTQAEAITPTARYVHSGHVVHYITHKILHVLRNTILSTDYKWGSGSPPETHDLLDPLGVPSNDYNCSAFGGEGAATKKESATLSGVETDRGKDLMTVIGRMEMHELDKEGHRSSRSRPATYPPVSAVYQLQFLKRREAWPFIDHQACRDSIPSMANSAKWTDKRFKNERLKR